MSQRNTVGLSETRIIAFRADFLHLLKSYGFNSGVAYLVADSAPDEAPHSTTAHLVVEGITSHAAEAAQGDAFLHHNRVVDYSRAGVKLLGEHMREEANTCLCAHCTAHRNATLN